MEIHIQEIHVLEKLKQNRKISRCIGSDGFITAMGFANIDGFPFEPFDRYKGRATSKRQAKKRSEFVYLPNCVRKIMTAFHRPNFFHIRTRVWIIKQFRLYYIIIYKASICWLNKYMIIGLFSKRLCK